MNEKAPPEIVGRVRRVEHLLPAPVVKAIFSFSRDEVLDLLATSMEATSEALLSAKARYLTGVVFLGDIQSGRRRQAEAHHVADSFEEAQLYTFKLEKLQGLYDFLLKEGSSGKKKPAPLIKLLFDGGDSV